MTIGLATEIDLRRAVEAGAELLDRMMPGWRNNIDVESLEMNSAETCILGQLYGDYTEGLYELGIWAGNPRYENGFSYNGPDTYEDDEQETSNEWLRLRELWVAEINKD